MAYRGAEDPREGSCRGQDQNHVLAVLGVLQPADRDAAAGFLKAEGLEPEFAVATPDRPARAGLAEGALDLIQSAVSASFAPLERGERSDLVHFAQINQRDGFFIAGAAGPRLRLGQARRRHGCWSITAASRSPCSGTRRTSRASRTAR